MINVLGSRLYMTCNSGLCVQIGLQSCLVARVGRTKRRLNI